MGYEAMGRVHAWIVRAWARERGQGTVEYVGLILLVAVILAGVVKASSSWRTVSPPTPESNTPTGRRRNSSGRAR